jgi:hypothetical protein
MLQGMSTTCASIFENLSVGSTFGLLLYSFSMARVLRLLSYANSWILQFPIKTPKKIALIPI